MSGLLTAIGEYFSLWRFSRWMLVLVLIVCGLATWKIFFKKNTEADSYLTAVVEVGDIQNLVTATGILQPVNYVDVGAQVSGQLKKLYVDIGSEVKAGDLLAEIDATVYTARVNGIRAQLLNQQAQVLDKQAQLSLAKIRLDRQKNLEKDDATTKDSLQAAESAYQSAQAQLKALQAQVQQTEFSLRVEEANLTYARIYAPMDGTVVSLTSRQGQTLNANQQAPTIMRIADLSTMTVQAQVSEADIGKLQVGMPVYFTTLGGKERRWYSKLNRIQPTPEVNNNVVLYDALFDVPNEKRVLMTQMSTQVFFIAAQAKDTLLIPASAVNFMPRKAGDWKKTTDNISLKPKDTNNKNAETTAVAKPENPVKESDKASASKSNSSVAEAKPEKLERKSWRHKDLSNDDNQPHPASVQVMDERGNLAERKVTIGVSNRVQVQVLDGLQEGEKVVSGMRQLDKPTNANASAQAGPGAPGAPGGAARMMR